MKTKKVRAYDYPRNRTNSTLLCTMAVHFIAIILYEALKTLSCFRFMAMSAYHRFAWLFGDDFHLRNENKPFRGHRSDGGKERDDL